jgi:serine/threonine protein kinase
VTRYELLDRIGVGGMAEIFRGKAVAAGGFEKPVAIKRILPHLSQDRRFVELLIAEAKVLSLLKHRNIVQIFDVGLGDDGQYFLVMEYVDGKDVGSVQRALETKRMRLPFDLCLHVGAEICEALEHAHTSRGPDGKPMALVHRDVSPSNVLLSRAGEVKLTDFGIAKRAESDATQGGVVRGKFAYISPEQARNEPLDPRSDVFSVGILLWELVCNRRLFSNLDDLAALRAVREPVVPRPTEVDPRLPREIDQLLLTALARDKTRRFANCGQLGQRLRSLRYSLDDTVGDPATVLAKIIESTEQVERESRQIAAIPSRGSDPFEQDGGEATVIRIHTADAFSAHDDDQSLSQARMVIDRFEEEETRQAQLTGDQLRMLRGGAARDSVEMTAQKPGLARDTGSPVDDEEMTRTHQPLDAATVAGYAGPLDTPTETPREPTLETPPHSHLAATDDTVLITSRDRRTPAPGVVRPQRAPTQPPPVPARTRDIPDLPQPVPSTLPGTPAPLPMQPMPQPPGGQQPRPQTPLPYAATQPQPLQPNVPHQQHHTPPFAQQPPPYYPPQPAGWGQPQIAPQVPSRDATPTAKDAYDRPIYPQRGSMPQVAGFQGPPRQGLQVWVLVVGALVMALVAFVITRALLG